MATLHITLLTLLILLALCSPNLLQEETTHTNVAASIDSDKPQIVQHGSEFSEKERSKRQYLLPAWVTNAFIGVPPRNNQIEFPYFVPVWGTSRRLSISLRPRSYNNPGYPTNNPPKSFPGLPYLPPVTDSPSTNYTSTKETDTKFQTDGPVWEQIPSKESSTTVRPTRSTRRPGQPVTHPPLVHKEETSASTTNKPTISTRRPTQPTPTQLPPKETTPPSRCVWAIISCCSANSPLVSYDCFEQQGCMGPFWDISPCESEFARAAIMIAMNYYVTS